MSVTSVGPSTVLREGIPRPWDYRNCTAEGFGASRAACLSGGRTGPVALPSRVVRWRRHHRCRAAGRRPVAPLTVLEAGAEPAPWLAKEVFFRAQHLTSEQQRDFARNWGELGDRPAASPPVPADDVVRFDKGAGAAPSAENVWRNRRHLP